MFKPAERNKLWLRMGLMGPSGSGKTFTALKLMSYLLPGEQFAGIDTENQSMRRYAPAVVDGVRQAIDPEKGIFDFQTVDLDNYDPENYIAAIMAAQHEGYHGLVIDSLSHAWNGAGGILDQKNKLDARGGNSFTNWATLTPKQTKLLDSIRNASLHVIVCFRSKQEYVIEQNERGKSVPKKVGLAPIQRDDVEYEFDIVGVLDSDHTMLVSKSRANDIQGEIARPGADFALKLHEWLNTGTKLPLTKNQFIDAMTDKGYDVNKMAAFVNDHKDLTGPTKWEDLLALA